MNDLKKALKENKVVFGKERTLKLMKLGKVNQVYIASNCAEDVRAKIEYYAKLGNIEIKVLKEPNDELGLICKKSFSVSVLSF